MKKWILKVVNTLSLLLIACSVAVLLAVVLTKSGDVPSIMGYSVFRVLTGSMEPAIRTDSILVVKKTDPDQIVAGDIITFYSRDPSIAGTPITHRVAAVETADGALTFRTKGDANSIEDEAAVFPEDVIGTVIFISHPLGVLVHLLSNPLIFFPVIALPLFVMVILNFSRSIRTAKDLAAEEEAEAVRKALEEIRSKREREAEEEKQEEQQKRQKEE